MAQTRFFVRSVLMCLLGAFTSLAVGQSAVFGPAISMPDGETRAWLLRIQEATKKRSFSGTFVFSAGGAMSSARITHYGQGQNQFERVDSLDGPPRQLLRHNDVVHTVLWQSGVVVMEKRDSRFTFPALLLGADEQVFANYEVLSFQGLERVAGRDAKVLVLKPKDEHRYGYRLWSDKVSGLLLRADVVGDRNELLESSAFSEVTIGVKAQPEQILFAIRKLSSFRSIKVEMTPTTLDAHGWQPRALVPGFKEIRCFERPWGASQDANSNDRQQAANVVSTKALQVIYSDGLTHVSVFIEPFDGARHGRQAPVFLGATRAFSTRQGDWWITAVGDVPMTTLRSLALGLQSKK